MKATLSEITAALEQQSLKDEHDKSFARRLSVNRLLLRKRLEEEEHGFNEDERDN